MDIRKKRIFFFCIVLIVSLLFYFLGRKQEQQELRISAREVTESNSIMVEKVLSEPEEDERYKIALTFDDGPHPYYTEQLLNGLKERNIHATFFVTGEHAELYPDIIKRMYEEGD